MQILYYKKIGGFGIMDVQHEAKVATLYEASMVVVMKILRPKCHCSPSYSEPVCPSFLL